MENQHNDEMEHRINDKLIALENRLNHKLADMEKKWKDQMAEMEQINSSIIERMTTSIDELERWVLARFQNRRARKLNHNGLWTPLAVESRREGSAVVTVVPQNQPTTREAIFRMSDAQITTLESQFNLPAGFFGGDTLDIRRSEVVVYYTHLG